MARARVPSCAARISLLALAALAAMSIACHSKPAATTRIAFEEGDTLRKYAERTGLLLVAGNGAYGRRLRFLEGRGHGLLRRRACHGRQELLGRMAPVQSEWLEARSFAELGPILTRHIEQAMGRDLGRKKIRDAFNEIFNDDGTFRNRQSRSFSGGPAAHSIWVKGSDDSLVKEAFKVARRIDPEALLFLNDYIDEEWYSGGRQYAKNKGQFFYDYVVRLRNEGVPIDGVGFQLHEVYPASPYWTDIGPARLNTYLQNMDKMVKRYAAQGLLVDFSEIDAALKLSDLDLATEKGKSEPRRRLEYQAEVYRGLMRIAPDNRNVVAFIVWGFSDRDHDTAPAGYGKPLLFDEQFKPKPAYYALLSALKERAMAEGQEEPRIK